MSLPSHRRTPGGRRPRGAAPPGAPFRPATGAEPAPRSHTARLFDVGYSTGAAAGGPAGGVLGPLPAQLTEPVTGLPGALAERIPGRTTGTARHTPPACGRGTQAVGWAR
jgi:hypothetical protein